MPGIQNDAGTARLTARLRAALAEAMSSRDVAATAAIRSALGAIGNAEAVAVPVSPAPTSSQHVAGTVGLGEGETARRLLSQAEISRIVAAEIAERDAAAAQYEALGHASEAAGLRRQALVLASILGGGR